MFAVWAAFADKFLVSEEEVLVVVKGKGGGGEGRERYAVELDDGADHAGSEGALLARRDVEGHCCSPCFFSLLCFPC